MDLPLTPNNINNIRTKLKRLTRHGILTEIEPGQFTTAQPPPPSEPTAALPTPTPDSA